MGRNSIGFEVEEHYFELAHRRIANDTASPARQGRQRSYESQMILDAALERRLRAAIRQFWMTRDDQAKKQGTAKETKDAGARAAVTGGAH